ncbi:replication initiator [Nocardioides sp.]|uniref:replication initiator n=1 Tax=Nocardioides sp. TaxID=35761 RepID=UPI002C76EC33|nr:replication initiator [Nocardioides sp.]HSX69047.1 replication initiator [Nocardioides sp.]
MDNHSGASPSASFWGFGDGAPLELPNMTPAAEAAIVSRLLDGSFDKWADTAAQVGNCANPIRLVGSSSTVDTRTGEVVGTFSSNDAPLGVLYVPCGNRRAEVCPACSRRYARDTFELLRAGVSGGKGVPESVGDNPLLFVTFTAPSFGHVHRHDKNGKRCRPRDRVKVCEHGRAVGCMAIHDEHDPIVGSPICWDCYDWHGAVLWQFTATELWRLTTNNLRRAIAQALGAKADDLGSVASLQYAKVAEYQARGLVHFHALIRLDGIDGPGSPAPMGARELAQVVASTVPHVSAAAPAIDADDVDRRMRWGSQLDVKEVRPGHRTDDPDRELTPEQVAGYLAKYVTKDATSIRKPGQTQHLKHMENLCRDLAARAREFDALSEYGLLRKWARMLGFRGHFSSKSRKYSVTHGFLRRMRQRFAAAVEESKRTGRPLDVRDLEARLLADDLEETTLVVGSWAYQGTGWTSPGDATLAASAAARAREYDQWRADQRKTA